MQAQNAGHNQTFEHTLIPVGASVLEAARVQYLPSISLGT